MSGGTEYYERGRLKSAFKIAILESNDLTEGSRPSWEISVLFMHKVGTVFDAVEHSEAILGRYLSNKQTATASLEQLKRLRVLNMKKARRHPTSVGQKKWRKFGCFSVT